MADVVLFRCHELGPQSLRLYEKLCRELPYHKVVAVGYVRSAVRVLLNGGAAAAFYDRARLKNLPYPGKLATVRWDETIGDNDLPVMQFFRADPNYEHYWIVEYDVHYTGDWREIFAELSRSSADLLATNILDREAVPDWAWWKTVRTPGTELAAAQMVKAFLPFARASARLLAEVDRRYREGWAGHYEAIWPIAARLAGMTLEDVGGDTPYTPPERRFRHYSSNAGHWAMYPGTFQYRPSYRFSEMMAFGRELTREPMLWHPVKQD